MKKPERDPKYVISEDNPNPVLTPKGIKKFIWKIIGNFIISSIGYILSSVFEFEKYNPDPTSSNLNILGLFLIVLGFMLDCLLIFNTAVTMWRHDY